MRTSYSFLNSERERLAIVNLEQFPLHVEMTRQALLLRFAFPLLYKRILT